MSRWIEVHLDRGRYRQALKEARDGREEEALQAVDVDGHQRGDAAELVKTG